MLLKLIGLIATVSARFGLGRAKFRVHVRMAILTALFAAVVQMSLKLALPHAVIEQFAHSHVYTAAGQIVLMTPCDPHHLIAGSPTSRASRESRGTINLLAWSRPSSGRRWATEKS